MPASLLSLSFERLWQAQSPVRFHRLACIQGMQASNADCQSFLKMRFLVYICLTEIKITTAHMKQTSLDTLSTSYKSLKEIQETLNKVMCEEEKEYDKLPKSDREGSPARSWASK